jgi:hypothetical protein
MGLDSIQKPVIVLFVTPTPTTKKNQMTNLTNAKSIAFVEACNSRKGQFIDLSFTSSPSPSKEYKGKVLTKMTKGIFRTGINFANLKAVKVGIEAGERGEVQSLPWGDWAVFPLVITNKGNEYLRITVSPAHKPTSTFFVDGVEVSKEHFESHLPPSARKPSETPTLVFNIQADNLISVSGLDLIEEVAGA